MSRSQVFTGPKAIFKIAGQPVAYASNVSYNINHGLQAIEVLDSLPPKEYAEVGYTVDFSCSTFRVAKKSAVALGIRPRLEAILIQDTLEVELQDKVGALNADGSSSGPITIYHLEGVKMQTTSGNTGARDAGTETWNFVGLIARQEDKDGNLA